MFHANAWGVPYAATMVGAKLVLPGAGARRASLYELFEAEGVTLTLGVPTVWLGLLEHWRRAAEAARRLERAPRRRLGRAPRHDRDLRDEYGVAVIQGWGMTEMSPVGTVGTLKAQARDLPIEEQHRHQGQAGPADVRRRDEDRRRRGPRAAA